MPGRLEAELGETDAAGRPILFDRVAIAGVIRNNDGAHHIVAALYQALNDVGFTVPTQGRVYWNGEAMHTTGYGSSVRSPSSSVSSMSGSPSS